MGQLRLTVILEHDGPATIDIEFDHERQLALVREITKRGRVTTTPCLPMQKLIKDLRRTFIKKD